MTDIVERLRVIEKRMTSEISEGAKLIHGPANAVPNIAKEAADEIERLQAALTKEQGGRLVDNLQSADENVNLEAKNELLAAEIEQLRADKTLAQYEIKWLRAREIELIGEKNGLLLQLTGVRSN